MCKKDFDRFMTELLSIASQSEFRRTAITPWGYDLLEPLVDEDSEIPSAAGILHGCLQFLTINSTYNTPLFYLEKRALHVFTSALKLRHADSIEFFQLSQTAMRCTNESFRKVFMQLSTELQLSKKDDDLIIRQRFTDLLITIMKMVYDCNLPMMTPPNTKDFRQVAGMDIEYDIVHNLAGHPYILRLTEEVGYVYTNVNTGKSIRLHKEEIFDMPHFLLIYKPKPRYDVADLVVDLSFYDLDVEYMDTLLMKANEVEL